jgi:hypothetical protein
LGPYAFTASWRAATLAARKAVGQLMGSDHADVLHEGVALLVSD